LQSLRNKSVVVPHDASYFDLNNKAFELLVSMQWGSTLRLHQSQQDYCEIRLDKDTKTLFFDRSNTQLREGDTVRELSLAHVDSVALQIFSDVSSLEIFINNGEAVMSSRMFTAKDATQLSIEGDVEIQGAWLLNKAPSAIES